MKKVPKSCSNKKCTDLNLILDRVPGSPAGLRSRVKFGLGSFGRTSQNQSDNFVFSSMMSDNDFTELEDYSLLKPEVILREEDGQVNLKFDCSDSNDDSEEKTKSKQSEKANKVKRNNYICDFNEWGGFFKTKEGLQLHIDSKHYLKLKPYKCAQCLSFFIEKSELQNHLEIVHLELKSYWLIIFRKSLLFPGTAFVHTFFEKFDGFF